MSTEQIGLTAVIGAGLGLLGLMVGWVACLAWSDVREGYDAPPPPDEPATGAPYKLERNQAVRLVTEQALDPVYDPDTLYLDSKSQPDVRGRLLRMKTMGNARNWTTRREQA